MSDTYPVDCPECGKSFAIPISKLTAGSRHECPVDGCGGVIVNENDVAGQVKAVEKDVDKALKKFKL